MGNFCEYGCLNIFVGISSFSTLHITVNTTLKYYHYQPLNKKLNVMGRVSNFSWKNLLGYEVVSSIVPWATILF